MDIICCYDYQPSGICKEAGTCNLPHLISSFIYLWAMSHSPQEMGAIYWHASWRRSWWSRLLLLTYCTQPWTLVQMIHRVCSTSFFFFFDSFNNKFFQFPNFGKNFQTYLGILFCTRQPFYITLIRCVYADDIIWQNLSFSFQSIT